MGTEDQPNRDSSKRLVEIAQEVMRTIPASDPTGASFIQASQYNKLLEKAKSLAGSVISQADPND